MGKTKRFGCTACLGQSFKSLIAAENHFAKYGSAHQLRLAECLCQPCNRWFWVRSSYELHVQQSPAHNAEKKAKLVQSRALRLQKKAAKAAAAATQQKPMGKKSVTCQMLGCNRIFKSPSAYSQHLESGTHRNVSRFQVAGAVEMLRVIPPIMVPNAFIQFGGTQNRLIAVNDNASSGTAPLARNAATTAAPGGDRGAASVEPGPPLGGREAEATFTPAVEPMDPPTTVVPSRTTHFVRSQMDDHLGAQPSGPVIPGTSDKRFYMQADMVNLDFPLSCPICLKAFRNACGLTAHMNSPVHDPGLFMCPNSKCDGKEFACVSGLIQHLESGTCKLAGREEIFDRFEQLTVGFSRLLLLGGPARY